MWRDQAAKSQPSQTLLNKGRFRLAIVAIFLIAGALIVRLAILQIKDAKRYSSIATLQHSTFSELKAERGKIFSQEKINGQEKLYPLATNKSLMDIYVVPQDITAPLEFAEKLYDYFDQAVVEKKIAEEQADLSQEERAELASSSRAKILDNYLIRVDKPGDPYETLNKKLNLDEFLEFIAFFASTDEQPLTLNDLELRAGQVYLKQAEGAGAKITIPGLGYELQIVRSYPEKEIGAHLLGFVSYADNQEVGKYGLEEFFNTELAGQSGYLKSEKAATANTIIVNGREYVKPSKGDDLVLTIDRNIESVACEKLKEAVARHQADGGSVIIIEPQTGAVIAMCSVPDFDPNNYQLTADLSAFKNPALSDQYEPGSVFKVITMAAAIDQEKVSPATTFIDEGKMMISGWPKPISNSDFSTHGPHGVVDMNGVLEKSLNTGAVFAMRQVGAKVFSQYVQNFGFGERSGIELGAESPGNIKNLLSNKIKEIDAATASYGQGIAVTPLQMVMSFQALANKGVLMQPHVVKEIIKENGQREEIKPLPVRQVVSAKTADTILAMLVNIVEKGHANRAYIEGYYTGGKTGTAQVAERGGYSLTNRIHNFVGIAPIEEPKFVMLTKIDNPKNIIYAEGTTVPLWREIADFMLKYYQIPKTRE
ncbi:MAG: peptidoglycan D,D-transpeptidase FtsI family protein [Patescibacteria group bacterium]|jgi:cell division protein FtsI/penicillin-binding protein 2